MSEQEFSQKLNTVDEIALKKEIEINEIPICKILDVKIAAINMKWLLTYLNKKMYLSQTNSIKGDYICVANVHTTVTAYEDENYCRIQNEALMAIPDGGPLSTVGRKRGYKNMERTTGPDLMGEIFMISAEFQYKHFFYGSTTDTLNKLKNQLEKKYLGIEIVGMYSPPFRMLNIEEDEEIIERINDAKPDFVWVGLGAPKQEKWMHEHQGKVDGLMIGVGAGFDYFAEKISRAPMWMQKCNLEWFYRLIQEPKRLLKRYLVTNSKFVWHAMIRGK